MPRDADDQALKPADSPKCTCGGVSNPQRGSDFLLSRNNQRQRSRESGYAPVGMTNLRVGPPWQWWRWMDRVNQRCPTPTPNVAASLDLILMVVIRYSRITTMRASNGRKPLPSKDGRMGIANIEHSTARGMPPLVGPIYLGHLLLIALATLVACALVVVLGRPLYEALRSGSGNYAPFGKLVPISHGHRMFLECTGESHAAPTVILATGRGTGSYHGWALVQSRVSEFAKVCSYDPLGAGESDHVPGSHPVSEVVENMHDLFYSAQIPGPFILVGNSLGGVLIRQYEEQYPADVAGFVFVDSAHEEMEWRDAAISTSFDPAWSNPQYLQENGLLPPKRHLEWHDDVPMIVLERTELPPCSAFPGLTQAQCDQINRAWHGFQVDLSRRSRYGQLRPVTGSGHLMQQQKPEAVSQAVSDVINEVQSNVKPR
jgi:pimeloyl-ACP methyl ester carboxylesterase